MSVTIEKLKDTLISIFGEDNVTHVDDALAIGVEVEGKLFELTIGLISDRDEFGMQSLEIYLWFCDGSGQKVDLRDLVSPETLDLVECLLKRMPWGSFYTSSGRDGSRYCCSYRRVEVTEDDVKLLVSDQNSSRIFRSLKRMFSEGCNVSDFVAGIASTQISDPEILKAFMSSSTATAI